MSIEKGIERIGSSLGRIAGILLGLISGLLAFAYCCNSDLIDFPNDLKGIQNASKFVKSLVLTIAAPYVSFLVTSCFVAFIFDWVTKKVIWIVEGFRD